MGEWSRELTERNEIKAVVTAIKNAEKEAQNGKK